MTMEPFAKKRLFCPGPTPLSAAVARHGHGPDIYHREDSFYHIFKRCRELLQPLCGSQEPPLILTASGTGAMEAVMTNLTAPGEEVVYVNAGKFGARWGELARTFGCQTHEVDVPWGQPVDVQKIVGCLNDSTKALFLQASETSTCVWHPIDTIARAVKEKFPNCLIIVDAITGLCAHEINMDAWGIDAVIGGSQKGVGIPPGLSFVALSAQARARLGSRECFYFDLAKELKAQEKGQTAYTPATSLIGSLQIALEELHQFGLSNVYAHHRNLAMACRAGVKALGLDLLVADSPSHAATAILVPAGIEASAILRTLKQDYHATFAGGQDQLKGKIIRLAHLGFVDRFDLLNGLAALEFALKKHQFSFELGASLSAAMEVMA